MEPKRRQILAGYLADYLAGYLADYLAGYLVDRESPELPRLD